jgi:hypothetical protein
MTLHNTLAYHSIVLIRVVKVLLYRPQSMRVLNTLAQNNVLQNAEVNQLIIAWYILLAHCSVKLTISEAQKGLRRMPLGSVFSTLYFFS